MGLLDALFDKDAAVTNALTNAGRKFAIECDVPVNEIQVMIQFHGDGSPHYHLEHVGLGDNGKKKWVKKRTVSLSEII